MKVYALVGKSGTGKSYQAMNLCKERNIESIIDDGLFIYENKVTAGISAKREATKIGAIKTALFTKPEHRESVLKSIADLNPEKILVIGTSDGMVHEIVKRLMLPAISEIIHIEDITTESERNIAQKQRATQGKHVIPAPMFQLKRQFSGYFVDPLRIIRGWGAGKGGFAEKSVVRPTYSYLGDYTISDKVITDIIEYIAGTIVSIREILRVTTENSADGVHITVLIIMKANHNIIEGAKELQKRCSVKIEDMTAFNVDYINISIRGIK